MGDLRCYQMIAIDYFAESLANPNRFYAQHCSSMDEIKADACLSPAIDCYLLGGSTSNYGRGLRGIFNLPVNAHRPFAVARF